MLSKGLSGEFGKGFSFANLKNFRQFYLTFPNFGKSYALRSELSWTHYRLIMRIENLSPKGNCAEEIMQELAEAKYTIDVAMYYFTAEELAHKLAEMSNKGVKVRVYFDED